MKNNQIAVMAALLAAALYALNVPFSKLLMEQVEPTVMAGLLYVGAGIGMGVWMLVQKICGMRQTQPLLTKTDLPYTVAMVLLDIAAPIFLMLGLSYTNAASVSLLNNLEIVFTSLIALLFFRERISARLWGAIALVTLAGALLVLEANEGLVFNKGSLLVLCACACWGLENNCTRSISDKSSKQIVLIKGIFSGFGSLVIAYAIGERLPKLGVLFLILLLGFVAYGLSIHFYISAQSRLGAAKTSSFYSVAPFLGVGFSFLILGEMPDLFFYIALAIMIAATVLMVRDSLYHNESNSD